VAGGKFRSTRLSPPGSSALQNGEHPRRRGRIDDDATILRSPISRGRSSVAEVDGIELPAQSQISSPQRLPDRCRTIVANSRARRAADEIERGVWILQKDLELLVIRSASTSAGYSDSQPFNLSTVLFAVQKECYIALTLIRQGGPPEDNLLDEHNMIFCTPTCWGLGSRTPPSSSFLLCARWLTIGVLGDRRPP
jgi:hypothetical protein